MTNNSMQYTIVIDSGGTKIKSSLFSVDGSCLDSHIDQQSGYVKGESNEVAGKIAKSIDHLVAKNSIPVDSVSIVAGISGINTDATAARAKRELSKRIQARSIRIVNDADLIGLSSTAESNIVVVCGTGSSVIGYYQGRGLFKCSGVNELLSDEGSAYWIGQLLLRATTKAMDGRTQPSPITTAVQEMFDCSHATSLQLAIESSTNIKRTIASTASLLTIQKIAEDPIAKKIADNAVTELYESILAVRRQMPIDEPYPTLVQFTGGVLATNHYIFDALVDNLTKHANLNVQATVVDPLVTGFQLAT